MTEDEEAYIVLEIIEEGTLNFFWLWAKRDFGWVDEEYALSVNDLLERGLATLYKYEGSKIIDVESVNFADLKDVENLKELNFCPTDLSQCRRNGPSRLRRKWLQKCPTVKRLEQYRPGI